MRRTSYQKGSLRLADRKKGKVWEFLWREVQLDGTIRRKHIVIGTQEDLPTESSVQAAVDAIRLEINQQTPQRLIKSISFETLVNHYRQHELPKMPGVVSLAILTGSFDVRLRVACKDQADLVRLIEALRTRAGAQETNSTVICREIEPCNWNI